MVVLYQNPCYNEGYYNEVELYMYVLLKQHLHEKDLMQMKY